MQTVSRNIPMKFHPSNLKTERQVQESLKSGPKFKVFWPKPGQKSKNSIFYFQNLMQTVSRNIPIKFHCSNVKTERLVCKSLKPVKTLKKYKFLAKIGPKAKFKIPLLKPHADSTKEYSYQVSSV